MNRCTLGLIAAAVLVAVAASATQAQPHVLAKVKVHNPTDKAMTGVVVRGALPLPADYDGRVEFLTLLDGGKPLPTQVDVMSTYPGSDEKYPFGRPEVVQLTAKVDLPANGFKELDVADVPRKPTVTMPKVTGEALAAILNKGPAVAVVEATDCYGNVYAANVLAAKNHIETRQTGPIVSLKVYRSVLTPVPGNITGRAAPALKKFLRVRAYLTTYAGEDFATLALMIHNGSVDEPNGMVYYRGIRLRVAEPLGVSVWQKQFSPAAEGRQTSKDGYTIQPCPPPAPDGKVYAMWHGTAAVLRTTLYTPAAKGRALHFAENTPFFVPIPSRTQWSWSNFATARYGGPKYPMPVSLGPNALAQADKLARQYLESPNLARVLNYRVDGRRRKALPWKTLGHAMPGGTSYGGKTGGDGVYYVFGVRAAVTGHNGLLKLHVVLADRHWDRQREHLFHEDGRPFTFSRMLTDKGGRKMLTQTYGHFGKWKLNVADPAAKAQAAHVKANDLIAPAAKAFLAYMDHDDQHLSRIFDAVPAAYLACDPVNRDRLVTLASQACWKLSVHPLAANPNSGGWLSLFDLTKAVDAKPHTGVAIGRSHGWVTHSLAPGFYLCHDEQIRADIAATAKADVEMRARGQMPGGNVQSSYPTGKALVKSYLIKPEDKDALAAYQKTHILVRGWEDAGIMANGARGVVNILSSPTNQKLADKMKQVYAKAIRWNLTTGWHERTQSPGFIIVVSKSGEGKTIPFGQPTSFMMGSTITWGYELTGDKFFLKKLEACAGKRGVAGMAMRHPNLGNWSYALWLTQGGKIPGR